MQTERWSGPPDLAAASAPDNSSWPGAGVPKIRLAGVGRSFGPEQGGVQALEDVDLELAAGEFVAIVGHSGCGKSTLLRLIAGLLEPTAGRIELDGWAVRGAPPNVAVVFQRPVLLDWRSVLDNVLLPLELADARRPWAGRRERGVALLRTLGLGGWESKRPRQLSGGMQQRVALARALITEPEVLLLDEPFSALDAITREGLQVELQRVWSAARVTALLVTHDIAEAVFLADRVAIMTPRPGRLTRIFEVPLPRPRTPDHRYAHEFIGLCRDVKRTLVELGTDA